MLFEAALGLEAGGEGRVCFESVRGSPELKRMVDELLAEEAKVGSFLENSPVDSFDKSIEPGTKIGQYEIVAQIGSGGMGEVFRARDSTLKREVAIKVLPAYVAQDPERLRRFEQEAQAAAALDHPNILAVHQFGTFEGAPYLVLELLTVRHCGRCWIAARFQFARRLITQSRSRMDWRPRTKKVSSIVI